MGKRFGLPVAFQKLKGLTGGSRRQTKQRRAAVIARVVGDEYTREVIDPRVQEVYNRLPGSPQDYRDAKRVAALENRFPQGTIPELLFYVWLERNEIAFTYQAYLFGGRTNSGGLLPDFMLNYAGRGLAIQIYGIYWHGNPAKQNQDAIDRMRMVGQIFNGVRIDLVVVIWENDRMYRDREGTYRDALNGIERPE